MPTATPHRRWAGVFLLIAAALLVALAWLKPLDTGAQTALSTGLKRALVAFAVVRGLDAAVSIAQESSVSLQPAGVGVTLAAGQVLDPINDLLEKVSAVLLAACASFGIQLLLLKLGGSALVSAALTVVLAAAAWRWWQAGALPRWLAVLASLMIVVRFAVPLASAGSELAFEYAMAEDYAKTSERLQGIETQASGPAAAGTGIGADPGAVADKPAAAGSFLDSVKSMLKGVELPEGVQMRGKVDALKARVENAAEDLMRVVAIFLVQTVLLPLLILFAMAKVASAAIGRP